MASLYYGKLAIAAASATEEAAGYPATNLDLMAIGRPWRSTTAGANDVIIDLGSSKAVDSLFVHDVNFATANVSSSPDGVTYTLVGALATYANRRGRRRGRISVGISTRFLKIAIAGGTPSDALTYWRIGAAYPLASKSTPLAVPNRPVKVTTKRPQLLVTLPNDIDAVASTGLPVDKIEFPVPRFSGDSMDDFVQLVERGAVVLDLEDSAYPEQIWPVRYVEPQTEENFDEYRHSSTDMTFTEIV